jgi:hypothetical protein
MKRIVKKLPIIHSLLLFFIVFTINSCSKEEVNLNPNTSDSWGEFISIPGIISGVAGDGASELKTSNEGVYMRVTKAATATPWIYRLQNGGIPTWTFHEQPKLYFDWEPSNETTESADDFGIFFQTLDKNGFVNINNGLPALLEEDNPYNGGFSFGGKMLVDNSSGGYKWAFFGSTVKIQDNTNIGKYNPICTLPPGGIILAEADPNDAIVWASANAKLYKITVNGTITVFDVSAYNDPNFFISTGKIRFSYDVLHKDVYFRYQNKVFKITDGSTLSLFYTINNGSNMLLGDFCVDNTYMYATDGTKKHLQLLTETNIIPQRPETTDQTILLDWILQTSAFTVGPIEVSKNPLDNYIYAISNTKLLKVPKSL